MKPVDEQMAILMQGIDFGDDQIKEVMAAELRERLSEGSSLRVYCGYDPTAPGAAIAITSRDTVNPAKSLRRRSASASCPMLVHTSV